MSLYNLAITFNPSNFIEFLKYMGVGMLVIFIVIGLIIIVTTVINRLCSPKKKNDCHDKETNG